MTTTKSAKKSRPAKTKAEGDHQFEVVKVEHFKGVPRGQVSSFISTMKALIELPKGEGILLKAPDPAKIEDYRSYLYGALQTALKQMDRTDLKFSLLLNSERTGFLLALRK